MFRIEDLAKSIHEKHAKRTRNQQNAQHLLEVYFKWVEMCLVSDRFYDVRFGKLGHFVMKKVLRRKYGTPEGLETLRELKRNTLTHELLREPGEKYRKHVKPTDAV